MSTRPATLLEELDVEGCMVENRRGELYRLAAKRIRELETELKIQDDAADILTRNADELRPGMPQLPTTEMLNALAPYLKDWHGRSIDYERAAKAYAAMREVSLPGPSLPQLEQWARDELAEDCNHLKYGSCMTLRCLKTNGCGIAHAVYVLDAAVDRT